MIVPEGYERMTDDELIAALVDDGVYDEEGAAAVVEILRDGPPVD